MKRFYKQAEAGTAPGGYTIRLDGRNLKTPLQHVLLVPTMPLAAALAAEWQAQGDDIVLSDMPLNQLVNMMIDKCAFKSADRAAMNAEISRFAGSDLICYFATHPQDLVARQEAVWTPLVAWVQDEYGVILKTIQGIQYIHQPPETLAKMQNVIEGLDAADFTMVQAVTALTGSVVIALGMQTGRLGAVQAFEAAGVDEVYQLEKWGEDKVARDRLHKLQAELETVEKFRFLLQAQAVI